MKKIKSISVIVPFYNEEENILNLYNILKKELKLLNIIYEMIFIDDGSIDKTFMIIKNILVMDQNLKVIKFQFNCGQTAAMQAGFDYASNDLIIFMDGDLQNDPKDISCLISKIEEGYDVVSGWRKNRKDKFLSRKLPSKIANKLISLISGVYLHDYGCSLKAYRRKMILNIKLYGEMHRFIPIYVSWCGARVAEIPVNHYRRDKGISKYGISRTFKVILDLFTIKFLGSYSTKPIYFFGGIGIFLFLLSFICILYLIYKQIIFGSFISSPFFLISMICILLGVQFILMGILAEIMIRIYYESQNKKPYFIERLYNINNLGVNSSVNQRK